VKAIEYAERAGESAAIQHGYEESARWYSTAVELLEASAAPDADRSCRVLLALGDVLSRAGNASEAKDALRRAAHVAQDQGWPDRLATAALAYGGRFAWARASTDPALVPLLEQALAAVGSDDDAARARLLARLAAATRDDAERARRVALAQEAVTLARRADDPTTLAYVLEGSWPALETQDPTDGIRIGAELIALSAQIGDPERAFLGHDFRLHGFWAFADRAGVDVEIDALARLADELAQPGHRWHVHSHRAMVALLEGRFGDAERLIGETRAMGQRAEAFNAVVSERLQLFVLRHAQGRVAELAPSLERSVHEYPALLRFPCALAHTYAAAGDERRARSALGELLAHDLAHHHVDAEWLFALSLLPDACRALADADAAATLYPVLLPYSHLYAEAPVEVSFGTTARALGVLATTLGEFADAEHHFEAAMEMERRMGAWPWIAHVSHDLAAMLLARGTTADRARASRLLAEATTRYVQLGMESWAERALALT
jgi:tetratricopeptide (TPR) repeat protein